MSTWILLRGLTRETRHWGRLPGLLQEALGADQIVMLDLPGNGEFADLRAPQTVARMVDFVRRTALPGGACAPYRVLAMSLGGMVAADWAQRYPGEIGRLVLINTSMRPFSRMHERLRPCAWPGLLDVAAHWRDAARAEGGIHRLTCNHVATRDADLAAWCEIRRSAPVSRGNAMRQLWAAARYSAAAAKPRCPLLILSSRADKLVNPVCSERLAAAWNATHFEHPWAGHDLPHDDPAWIIEQVSPWSMQQADAPKPAL
jgi:pimeloyl-ACP methyl ester carboxylesterase